MELNQFLDTYLDLLCKEIGKEAVLDIVLQRWEIGRLYNTTKKNLISSRKKQSRNALSRTNRRTIIKAIDKDYCQYCGRIVDYFEVDHVKPIDDLGTDELNNVVTACHSCNRVKGDRPKEGTRAEVERRRKDFLLERANLLFNTKRGRAILKNFVLENPKE